MSVLEVESLIDEMASSGKLERQVPPHPRAPSLPDLAGGIGIMEQVVGVSMPEELKALFRRQVVAIGRYVLINPVFRLDRRFVENALGDIKASGCIPVFRAEGACYFGLDVTGADAGPAVYFFDHDGHHSAPDWAAASSLVQLLKFLAESEEDWDPWYDDDYLFSKDPAVANLTRAPLPGKAQVMRRTE